MKPFIIITCCNAKFGDFLIHHWLRSLKENVNVTSIDIAVIDYGLTTKQQTKLAQEDVLLLNGNKHSNIVNSRFIDIKYFLEKTHYQQVLSIDGGDVIFQADIAPLFSTDVNEIRITAQDINHLFFEIHTMINFQDELRKRVWDTLKGKTVLNAGVIFAPVDKFIALCHEFEKIHNRNNVHFSDQIIINYLLYKKKFVHLDKTNNYMIGNVTEKFTIKNGVFYRPDGSKPAIIHNPGRYNAIRSIARFGYGKNRNRQKFIMHSLKNAIYSVIH